MIFSPSDPFNRQIPQPDPNSAALAQFFVNHAGSANLASDETWGIPVYQGTLTDPYVTAVATKYNKGVEFSLRLPLEAKPQVYDANDDGEGKMVVFGPIRSTSGAVTGVQYETDFFGVGDANGVLQFDSKRRLLTEGVWQQRCDLDAQSTTVVQQGVLGHIMASGVQQSAGLIFASELAAGEIPHALAVTIPETLDRTLPGAFRAPANQTDGTHSPGVPMGTHIQLDPAYDAVTLNATAWVVAKALQKYGAYVVDTGGSFSFYAESTLTGIYPSWFDPHGVRAIDWTRLRVLAS